MTVTPPTPPATPSEQPADVSCDAPSRKRRTLVYVIVLVLVGLAASAAVVAWPLYGTAAAVIVSIVIAITDAGRA